MPRYTIRDAQTGRTLTIEGDSPPTEAEMAQLFGAQVDTPASVAATQPLHDRPPMTAQQNLPAEVRPERSLLQTVGAVVGASGRQAAELATSVIKGRSAGETLKAAKEALSLDSPTTWETPLAAAGMKEGPLRTGLGLAGDIVLDPMWFANPIAKGVGVAAKLIPGAAKVGKLATSGGRAIAKVAEPLTEYVVRHPGTAQYVGKSGETAETAFLLHDAELEAARSVTRGKIAKIFTNVRPPERQALSFYLDNPLKNPLPAHANLTSVAEKAKDILKTQWDLEVAKGVSDPAKFVADYIPYVTKGTQGRRKVIEVAGMDATSRFSKARKMETLEDAVTHGGAETDAALAIEARLVAGQRATKTVDFVDRMATDFGTAFSGAVPSGLKTLDVSKFKMPAVMAKKLETVAFPPEIVRELEKTHVVWAEPEGLKNILRMTNRVFKTMVTTLNPAHHANNLQGNLGLMTIGDMAPAKAIGAYAPNKISELHALMDVGAAGAKSGNAYAQVANKTIGKAGGRQYTLQEVYDAAAQYNLFGSSEAAVELSRALGSDKARVVQTADQIRRVASRFVEDPARWGLMKDQIEKGATLRGAITHTKKFLFDYNNLTDFEKGLRDYGVSPFYSWMRKNLPLQIEMIATKPARFNAIRRAYTAPERFAGQDILSQPDWYSEEGYVPQPKVFATGKNFLGPDIDEMGNQRMMRLANPQLDINKLSSLKALAGGLLGPIPRIAIERGLTDKDLRTGSPLANDQGYTTASPVGTLLARANIATGLPIPSFGTIPTPTGFIQGKEAAYWLKNIPNPMIPYMQRAAGLPEETLGTQLKTPGGRAFANVILQAMGLSTRNLTPDQQLRTIHDALKKMDDELNGQVTEIKGKAFSEALRPK